MRVLNHAGRAYNGVYEQRVVGWLRGTDAVRLFAEFLNRFREFSEPFISPLVELPVKRRDKGDSQGATDNRDEVQLGFDCPFGDLPASDSFVGGPMTFIPGLLPGAREPAVPARRTAPATLPDRPWPCAH